MLGTPPIDGVPRTDVLASLVPIVPVSAREFSPQESVRAFLRIYQGGADPLVPIGMSAKFFDIGERELMNETATLAPDAFDARRGAPYQVALPLAKLTHGPYLLSITATLPSGTTSAAGPGLPRAMRWDSWTLNVNACTALTVLSILTPR